METTGGPNDGRDRLKPDLGANVVHFPRDWFGPPEDLVPIGSRAAEQRKDPDAGPDAPVAAEGFWGGAVIDGALAAPEVRARPRAWGRRWAPACARTWASVWAPLWALLWARRRSPFRRLTIPLGAAAVVITCVTVALQVLATHSPLSAPPLSAITNHETAVVQALTADASAVLAGRTRAAGHRVTLAARRAPRVRHVVPMSISSSSSVPEVVSTRATSDATSTSAQTSASEDGTAANASEPIASGASGGNASGGNASASNAGASNANSASSGPQGPGAPFGPGHLG